MHVVLSTLLRGLSTSPVYMIAVVHSLAASSMLYRDSRDSYRIFCLGGELIKTWMKISVKGSSP